MAIAICALITSLAFQIRSMSPPFLNHGFEELDISSALFFCIDIIRVSISIHPHRVFMAYRLIVSSSTTLFGYRSKAPVYRYILRKAKTTLSSRSFQMSSYSSRCLLAYFVWAKTPPCSAWGSSSGGRWVEGVSPSLIVHICFERVCYGSS